MPGSGPTEFSSSDGRRFAFPVSGAFLVLALVLMWRGRGALASVLVGLSGALLLAGLFVPARLGPAQRGWMRMAHAISRVTTPVFMAGVYYGVLTPMGLVMRGVGRNPIVHRPGRLGYWRAINDRERSDLQRQF